MKVVDERVSIVIQVNGRLRGAIEVQRGATEAEVRDVAMTEERIFSSVKDKTITRVIFVTDKLLNLVVR
jgi:leucyl-tRNA synthetase